MTIEVMEYIVWVVEIAAEKFFGGNKTAAYNAIKTKGIWELYTDCYDTTHTLGKEYLLDEMRELLIEKSISFTEG